MSRRRRLNLILSNELGFLYAHSHPYRLAAISAEYFNCPWPKPMGPKLLVLSDSWRCCAETIILAPLRSVSDRVVKKCSLFHLTETTRKTRTMYV